MSIPRSKDDPLRSVTALYVEDEADARELTTVFLSRRLREVFVATNGREALAAFAEHHPDIVVTDVLMPEMDGLALAEAIKAASPTTPIVLVTAFENAHYMRRAIEIGVDRYVLKPIEPDQFVAALEHAARQVLAGRERQAAAMRERELVEARHAAAIGSLAGGLAHDYNNLLQGILGGVSLAQAAVAAGQNPAEFLELAAEGFPEAARLARRLYLLDYKPKQHEIVSIDRAIEQGVTSGLEGSACVAHITLPPGVLVPHDAETLARVSEAIARNAVEAMPHGGTLDVTGTIEGERLHLVFRDTGKGIAPELLANIFEPYVSSKPRSAQRGMGLSLAIVRAVVTAHGGTVSAESVPGDTRIHVYLPMVAAPM